MKNNIELVKHCEMALNEKWGYVWGTFGQVLTPNILSQKIKQYPSGVGKYETFIRRNWLNKRSVDCIGLLKSYLWWNDGNLKYNGSQDKNADGSYQSAKEKGPIRTLPELVGTIVYKKGHVGVYIGNGNVIEARGTKIGVIKSPLTGIGSAGWTHWFKSPYINYEVKGGGTVSKDKGVSNWAKSGWEWATKEGIIDGTRPKDSVTREELAVIVQRILERMKI